MKNIEIHHGKSLNRNLTKILPTSGSSVGFESVLNAQLELDSSNSHTQEKGYPPVTNQEIDIVNSIITPAMRSFL